MLLSSSFHYRLTTSGLTEVCVRGSFRFIPSTAHRPQHVSQYTDLTRHGSLSGACYEESQGALFGDFGDVVRLWGRGETTHTGAQWLSVAASNFDLRLSTASYYRTLRSSAYHCTRNIGVYYRSSCYRRRKDVKMAMMYPKANAVYSTGELHTIRKQFNSSLMTDYCTWSLLFLVV